DRRHMGFGPLRVINEDVVAAGQGFPTHGHRDMEIITYVLEGQLAHKDSLGTGSVVRPGDVQRMSAGTGVRHSEFNPSPTDPLHLLQIWIEPSRTGVAPSYEEKIFSEDDKRNRLRLVASPDGRDGSVMIHQDAFVYAAVIEAGREVVFPLEAGRRAWLQVARGRVAVNGQELEQGDGAGIDDERALTLTGKERAEVILFDLP
ncbi:MAG: pirin family protein, partial [Candidatus Rokuibacteriota bacterium]